MFFTFLGDSDVCHFSKGSSNYFILILGFKQLWIGISSLPSFERKRIWIAGTVQWLSSQKKSLSVEVKPDLGCRRSPTKEQIWNQQHFLPFIYNQSNHGQNWGWIEIKPPRNGNSHFHQMMDGTVPDMTNGTSDALLDINPTQLTTRFLPSFLSSSPHKHCANISSLMTYPTSTPNGYDTGLRCCRMGCNIC